MTRLTAVALGLFHNTVVRTGSEPEVFTGSFGTDTSIDSMYLINRFTELRQSSSFRKATLLNGFVRLYRQSPPALPQSTNEPLEGE